jgi:phage terminase small subunit
MARHAQPREVAELKGATRHNPQRYVSETPKNDRPLGAMPDHLTPEAKAVWFEVEEYLLPGVMTAADRLVMEMLCELLAEFRAGPKEFPANRLGHLIGCLARFGMSPADRQKLGTEKPKEGNPFDQF